MPESARVPLRPQSTQRFKIFYRKARSKAQSQAGVPFRQENNCPMTILAI
jgi:hypothetical protein